MVVTAVATGVLACCCMGCQSMSPPKMTKPDWLSWGKKKPASSTLGSTAPGSNLPAPPSSIATPNPAPSYATRPGIGSAAPASNMGSPATGAYGAAGGTASPYANASYGNNTPAAGVAQNPTGSPYAQPRSPGGYPAAGYGDSNYGQAAGTRNAVSNPGPAGGANAGYGGYGQSPSSYQNPYANNAATGDRGATWGGGSPVGATPRAGSAYDASSRNQGYNTLGQGTSPYAAESQGGTGSSSVYGQPPPNYGSANAPRGSVRGPEANESPAGYPDRLGARAETASGVAGGGYRPGSTGRPTRFGNSQQIDVRDADGVRSASFNTANDAGSADSTTDRNAAGSAADAGGEYETGSQSPARTATGGSGAYPASTYQR
jgi:hypothetical protein